MNNIQKVVYAQWVKINPTADIVEPAQVAHNETFGDVAYFTARWGKTFIELGIKPNGDIFTVR